MRTPRAIAVRARLAVVCLAAACLATTHAYAAPYRFPMPVERSLPNGLRVAVFPNSRLPIVQVQLRVPAGTAMEPVGQEGVAHLTAELIRHGTTSRSPRQFTLEVERLGGTVSTGVTRDLGLVSGSFLSEDLEGGLDLMSDAVSQPIFDPAEFSSIQDQTLRQIAQSYATPSQVADDQLWQSVFAAHPYARGALGSPGAVARMTRAQLVAFHSARYRPDGAVLAIAGDVTVERAFKAAEDAFGSWGGTGDPVPARREPPKAARTRVRIVDAPSARTELRIGFALPGRPTPAEVSVPLASALFAGPPASRPNGVRTMFDREVRTGATFLREGGMFAISLSVPNDSVAAAVQAVSRKVQALGQSVAQADFEAVRRTSVQTFPLSFESLGSVTSVWLSADFCGEPKDYFARYPERIAALTADQVAADARRLLDPAQMTVVAVGPSRTLEPELRALGEVEVVDLVPHATAADTARPAAPPTTAEIQRGRELIREAAVAHGGLPGMQKVRDSVIEAEITLTISEQPLGGELTQTRKEPDRMISVTRVAGTGTRQVLVGGRAWQQVNQEPVHEMDSLAVAALRDGFTSDVPHLIMLASRPEAKVYARGSEVIDGAAADAVIVEAPSLPKRRYYLDAKSHQVLGFDEGGALDPGIPEARRTFSDYRRVGALLVPFGEQRMLGGRPLMHVRVSRVVFDSGINNSEFEIPGATTPH